jgi:hypothetical protein
LCIAFRYSYLRSARPRAPGFSLYKLEGTKTLRQAFNGAMSLNARDTDITSTMPDNTRMPTLTRRRDDNPHRETWHVYCGDRAHRLIGQRYLSGIFLFCEIPLMAPLVTHRGGSGAIGPQSRRRLRSTARRRQGLRRRHARVLCRGKPIQAQRDRPSALPALKEHTGRARSRSGCPIKRMFVEMK